jgi:hypothetical protein
MNKAVGTLIALLILFSLTQCVSNPADAPPNAPVIDSLAFDSQWINVGSTTLVTCVLDSESNENLSYDWHADAGQIIGQGSTIKWSAPNEANTYSLTCTVTDEYDQTDKANASLKVDIKDGLIAYYPLDSNVEDYSLFGNDGAEMNGPNYTIDRLGRVNSALHFDGLDDYVEVPSNSIQKPFLPVTITFWTKIEGRGGIFTNNLSYDSYNGIWISVHPNYDRMNFNFADGNYINSNSRQSKYMAIPAMNKWVHVAAIIRGAQDISLYVNGQKHSGTYSGSGGRLRYKDAPVNIGRVNTKFGGPESYFQGDLDEFRMYDRELSEQEITSIYISDF